MLTDSRRVKPVTQLHVNQWLDAFTPALRALLLPYLPDPFDIALHKVCGVRFAAVGNHLNRRCSPGARHVLRKVCRDNHYAADFSRLHELNQFLAVIADGRLNVGRSADGMSETQRFFALLFQQNPHVQAA
ncbi:hypothetical protein SRABI106_03385 [Rahnella aquatilis]|nr:hypothetical protein SRABI106_03385 [Rahnella aquatilis]